MRSTYTSHHNSSLVQLLHAGQNSSRGFRRGSTTLGVSGQLLNSNLVMYDRASRRYFSQIAAVGLSGPHRGRTLDEVRLIWTTWERWRAVQPRTQVLSERTGHLRNYARDPYGSYNPLGGYYAQDQVIFPLMHRSERRAPKDMVIGARTEARSASFRMADLARSRVQATEHFVAVYDPRLDTGHIYVRDRERALPAATEAGTYDMDGRLHRADELPLTPVIGVEAFHFAWHAFYPRNETP